MDRAESNIIEMGYNRNLSSVTLLTLNKMVNLDPGICYMHLWYDYIYDFFGSVS